MVNKHKKWYSLYYSLLLHKHNIVGKDIPLSLRKHIFHKKAGQNVYHVIHYVLSIINKDKK